MPFKNPALQVLGPGSQSVELTNNPLTGAPEIDLSTGASTETQPAKIGVSAAGLTSPLYLDISGPVHQDYDPSPPSIQMSTFAGALPSGGRYINFFSDHLRTDQPLILNDVWVDGWLLGTWVDVAGARIGALKDAAGNIHLRGNVNGGATVSVGQLPGSDYYPQQSYEFVAKGGAGVGVQVAWQVTTTGQINILTNLASAQVRMPLFAVYSTL